MSLNRTVISARLRVLPIWVVLSSLNAVLVSAQPQPLSEITVSADALSSLERDLPSSVSIVDEQSIEESGQTHFGDIIDQVPNFSWSGGTNRPRYFQIRGIGELEQYEGAPNPSVALLVDDFDFSSLGGVATLFDIDQVEVLRGPQGLRYGANALAGLVHLKTKDPTPYLSANSELSFGNDELIAGGAAVGGPVDGSDGKLQLRVAAYQQQSNGFRDNVFLSRDDTNRRDELTARVKLRWQPSDPAQIDIAFLHIDLDDGYDAFAIDNSLTTQSDRPGQDAQRSDGLALKSTIALSARSKFVSTTSLAQSDIRYSFDGDWGNNDFWGEFAPYDYFSDTSRQRQVMQQEFRVQNDKPTETRRWLFGLYGLRLAEGNRTTELADDVPYDYLDSDYAALNSAAFAQIEQDIGDGNTLSAAARIENRAAHYVDSRSQEYSPNDLMYGGHVALSHALNQASNIYLLTSRGYKAGGFNLGTSVPQDLRQFSPEYLWNLESGVKASNFDGALESRLALFYNWRRAQQAKSALQSDPNDPLAFTFVTENAAGSYNAGAEAEVVWALSKQVRLYSNAGLLRAKFTHFDGSGHFDGVEVASLSGREQSDAPTWQYTAGLRYQILAHLFARTEVTGKDSFYFDDSHDQRSKPYELFNAALGWSSENWSVTAWGRNLLDRGYAVRGFYFGNEPPDFPNKLYIQRGDARAFGVTFSYFF